VRAAANSPVDSLGEWKGEGMNHFSLSKGKVRA